ncbi:MAG: response regulator transcription factor [Rhodoferax sp.]|jgi:DNA-binding NarL/FixJ family response regulator|nr:response regulator transcription factor [Rhodoferax sp.]
MNAGQHFLGDRATVVPDRWHQAFPAGQTHTDQELSAQGVAAWQGLLWISSDDPHWQDHMRQISQLRPDLKVVLLSSAPDPQEGLLALNAGARGYTHAYAVVDLLKEVAVAVQHGGLWVGPDLLKRLVGATADALIKRAAPAATAPTRNAWAALSVREAQVARLVSAGYSNKEVAAALFISERTVKAHLGTVFEKLGVRDRLQLVLLLAASPDPGAPAMNTAA